MAKKRIPSQDELALWKTATRNVSPLVRMKPQPAKPSAAEPSAVVKSKPVERVHAPVKKPVVAKPFSIPALFDAETERRLQKNQARVEARMDLHGMTEVEAHRALVDFVTISSRKGFRLILIITGKGAEGRGVLKKNLPLWIEGPALRRYIAATRPALDRHGGEGAIYLMLKRKRILHNIE